MRSLAGKFIRKVRDIFASGTIKSELMIAFFLVALVPVLAINLYHSLRISILVEEKVISIGKELVKQAGNKIDSLLEQVEAVELQITAHIIGSRLFSRYRMLSPGERWLYTQLTEQYLRQFRWVYSYISNIYLINWDDQVYSSDDPNEYHHNMLISKGWIEEIKDRPFEKVITSPHEAEYVVAALDDDLTISYVRHIKSIGLPGLNTIIQIDLRYAAVRDIIESVDFGKEGLLVVVDDGGKIVAFAEQDKVGADIDAIEEINLEGITSSTSVNVLYQNSRIAVTYDLSNSEWRMIGIIPVKPYLREFGIIRNVSLIITLGTIAFSIAISVFLSERITKPITSIIKVMEGVGAGNFSQKVPDAPLKDIHILASNFNQMVDKVNALMSDIISKEQERTRAELAAFQARINPHFLYNTLEVIRGIAFAKGVYPIVDIAKYLAKLFRFSIDKEKEFVTISEEVESIRNYVSIQKFRYGDRFDVQYSIDNEIIHHKIIKLILQPLVENAFYHGIESKVQDGRIIISGYRDNGRLILKVEDNGVGIEKGRYDQISDELERSELRRNADSDYGIGIGIINVNRRLKLHYGSQYGLRLSSSRGAGTSVEIHLPPDT